MGNYSLQKYKGTATRHTCPKCGDRHSFVYYVDENNVPLHPSVGRCNHESGLVGLTPLRRVISKSILNTELPMISLLTGKEQSRRK